MPPPDLLLVGGNAPNIVRVFLNEVEIEIIEGAAHLVCMLLVYAKDDRLGEAVCLLKKVSKMARDGLGPSTQGYNALEILGTVLQIWDFPAIPVQVALAGSPAGGVPFGYHPVDAVRC